jgi:hypothetical protein
MKIFFSAIFPQLWWFYFEQNTNTMKKNPEIFLQVRNKTGPKVNMDENNFMFIPLEATPPLYCFSVTNEINMVTVQTYEVGAALTPLTWY